MGKLKDALLINPAYIIDSTVTNGLFIDSERSAYVFLSKKEADKYIAQHNDVCIRTEPFIQPTDFFSACYAAGVTAVHIVGSMRQETVSLNKRNVKKDFYNSTLNAAITLFKETKEPRYIRIIASCWFLIPARINFDLSPEIVYGAAHLRTGEYKYLAFSDMNEYNRWGEHIAGWTPLLVNFDVMCQISKKCGYIINPKGNSIMLPEHIMEKYRKYASNDDISL